VEQIIALCGIGAEKALSQELKKLGFPGVEPGFGKVRFSSDPEGLYRALMGLRSADRVLLEIASFRADTFDALFEGTEAAPWENFIPKNMGLRIAKVRTNRSVLGAETSIQAVVHKAGATRLCRRQGLTRLPDYGKTAALRVYIEKNQVSLLLDLAGEPLFKRGYRSEGGLAPLRETTAAALLLLAGWRRKFPLYDPFCGSGTLAIEAALFAWDMAPGLGRSFALSDLLIGNRDLERKVRENFLQKINFSPIIRIYGSDADSRSVALAKANAERAYELARGLPVSERGVRAGLPDFRTLSFDRAVAPAGEGLLITNPPYGKRLGDLKTAEQTYQALRALASGFPGWKAGIITDHPGFESFFGRKADSCREITNGAIRSYFFQYNKV
jgi:putative N6-adenine-specific DNA methylase